MKTKRIVVLCAATLILLSGSVLRAADAPGLAAPVKPIYDHYLKIEAALANDSVKGVEDHAIAIARAARGEAAKVLTPEVAKQADSLARAKDLKAARDAFKPLSKSLIQYLADHKVAKGTYYEAYCPMVKASWLQSDKIIKNPYMGKSMLTCGEIKE